MLKIVCLIRPDPPLIYFVNRIHERHKVNLVVVEKPRPKRNVLKKLRAKGFGGIAAAVRYRLTAGSRVKLHADYRRFFQEQWQSIDDDIEVMEVESVNADAVHARLKSEKPDLILDHGTSIVRDHILDTADLALNLHWGLSPYYRGTHCTDWALVNWDPMNIGVTIHKLSKIIDGGEIVCQRRASVGPDDNLHSINMQLTHLGTELVVEAIDRILRGDELEFHKQDYASGFLTLNRQWTRYLSRQIEHIEKSGLVSKMLDRPARKQKLPIIEW